MMLPAVLLFVAAASVLAGDPEIDMNAMEIIRYYGYEGEEHEVVTEDGYILQIQRLPCSRNESLSGRCNEDTIAGKPVVFLQHGLLCASTDFLINLPSDSWAFVLADAGFDVWLGNVRGNTYGRQHQRLSPDSKAFWQFTFDQMAQFDLPNMIDYVLTRTLQQQLTLIGHSQGTIIPFAAFSTNEALQAKIKKFFALGPVGTVGHVKGPLKYIAPFVGVIEREFLPSTWFIKTLARLFCRGKLEQKACESLIFLLTGPDSTEMNQTRIPVIAAHDPAGTSTLNMAHWGQMVNSDKFQMFNYGSKKENMRVYHQATPPLYNLDNVHVKTYLYYGGRDWLADPTDVEHTLKDRAFVKAAYKFESYNHLDFLWAMNLKERIMNGVIRLVKE